MRAVKGRLMINILKFENDENYASGHKQSVRGKTGTDQHVKFTADTSHDCKLRSPQVNRSKRELLSCCFTEGCQSQKGRIKGSSYNDEAQKHLRRRINHF